MSMAATETEASRTKTDDSSFPVLNVDPADTGLKVTPNAWKWPVSWPYVGDYFDRENTSDDAAFYTGAANTDERAFDTEGEAALQGHFSRFIAPNSNVLELGAGAHSYLPEDLKLARHVGIGLSCEEMKQNSRLTEAPLVQDLNVDTKLAFEDSSFDTVLITNSVEFFLDPKALLREVLRVLRPEGRCIVSFTGKDAYKQLKDKQVKMWRDMNDAQHMWIIGSFFHFSAGESWTDLKGYDLSPSGSQGLMASLSGSSKSAVYVVQAKKAPAPTDPMGRIRVSLRQADGMDGDELELCALRLFAEHREASSPTQQEEILEGATKKIPQVYQVLSQLKRGVLFPPYKALLAVRLVCDGWDGNDKQVAALKEGLGMTAVGEEFWGPLGKTTMQLNPEDKVLLLGALVPLFGSKHEDALTDFIPELEATIAAVKRSLPEATVADAQLLATDLMLTDYVKAGEQRSGFLPWLNSVEPKQLQTWLDERKNYKEAAKAAQSGVNEASDTAAAAAELNGANGASSSSTERRSSEM